MKLRTQLGLAFFLLAVVPLVTIVLVSQLSSQRAFRRAVKSETEALALELGARMESMLQEMATLVEELGSLPLHGLLGGEGGDLGETYSQLVEQIGEVSQLVEWFELTPVEPVAASESRSPGDPYVIFPSEALANALRKLNRYQELDPETAATLRESMQATLAEAIKERRSLAPKELEALEAGAERARRVLGTEFRSPVRVGDELVGHLKIQVRPYPMLRRVLARTERGEGEIPYALDGEGSLYVADPEDKERLAQLAAFSPPGTASLAAGGSDDWMVAERRDPESGLTFGIARPIRGSLQEMQRTAVRNFVLGLAIIGLALAGVLVLSARMTRRVTVLTRGAEQLRRGERQVRVPEGPRDELGQLARTFNRMARELSEKEGRLVAEERRRREQEMERRLLQAENERKSLELEEARQLQLSLLPRSLPEVDGLDFGVLMETATEVGGDYYDFFQADDGALTVAIGDATGHGARAGTLVTVVKGLLSLGAGSAELARFLEEANTALYGMDLGRLSPGPLSMARMSMALSLIRIRGRELSVAAAGMPPALLYRAASRSVEEIALAGTPLGSLARFDYRQWSTELGAGDTLLLMSDGFPELLGREGQPLGYPRAWALFEAAAEKRPSEIIAHLVEAAAEWNGNRAPEDDITFVVLKTTADGWPRQST